MSHLPGFVGIVGNEMVDKFAKEGLSHGCIDFDILPDVKHLSDLVLKLIVAKWQERWNLESKGRFYYALEPEVSLKVKYSDQNKARQTTLSRLRFGKCLLNDTLELFRQSDGLCNFCLEKEDVKHFLLNCLDYNVEQDVLVQALHRKGFTITLANLLGNKCFYDLIWEYVCNVNRKL